MTLLRRVESACPVPASALRLTGWSRAFQALTADARLTRGKLAAPAEAPGGAVRLKLGEKLAAALLVCAALGTPLHAQSDDEGLPPPPLPHKKLPAVRATASPRPEVLTGFDPRRDGMPFGNNGDYSSPDGNCFGMSLLAIDQYLERTRSLLPGELPPTARSPRIVERAEQGDVRKEAAAAIVQREADVQNDDARDNGPRTSQRAAAAQIEPALERIAKTGVPEVIGLYAGPENDAAGHAVVLYGYKDGKLQIYDPNYPGETIQWPYDPKTGLGRHPKAGEDDEIYGPKALVTSTPPDKYAANKVVGWATSACDSLAKECTDHFPTVTAAVAPAPANKKGPRVAVTGTITGGYTKTVDDKPVDPPHTVWLAVNGKPVAAGRVEKDGSYRLVAPASAFSKQGGDTIRVVATSKGGALAGFVEQASVRAAAPSETPGAAAVLGRGR